MCDACKKMNGLGRKSKATKSTKTMGRKKRSSRVSGLNTKDVGKVAQTYVLPGIAGAIAARYLHKLPVLNKYKQYENYAAVGVGLLVAVATKNPMITAGGIGMAISGGAGVGVDLLDGTNGTNGLGLLPGGTPLLRIAATPAAAAAETADLAQIKVR